jgi:hypothetical protein
MNRQTPEIYGGGGWLCSKAMRVHSFDVLCTFEPERKGQ